MPSEAARSRSDRRSSCLSLSRAKGMRPRIRVLSEPVHLLSQPADARQLARSVLIIDNCSLHHDGLDQLREIVEGVYGAVLLYTPQYCPRANAIEAAAAPGPEFGEIRFSTDGTTTVLMGTKNQGQGHETMYKQIVGERLGLDAEDVRVVDGDTDQVAFGLGTMGSRSMVSGGTALYRAADKIIEKASKIAAHMLEAGESDLEFQNRTNLSLQH